MKNKIFKKRKYENVKEIINDIIFLLKNLKYLNNNLSKKFKERLMLAETEVNNCKYCSFLHTKIALLKGLKKNELNNLIKKAPKYEVNALIYAQHYADTKGKPNQNIIKKLIKEYGKYNFNTINFYLHLMKMGNYFGNSFDYLLFKIKMIKI